MVCIGELPTRKWGVGPQVSLKTKREESRGVSLSALSSATGLGPDGIEFTTIYGKGKLSISYDAIEGVVTEGSYRSRRV